MTEVKNFPGYFVTKKGTMFSNKVGDLLKPLNGSKGRGRVSGTFYMSVMLRKNNKSYSKRVHRLVAEAFIPNPKNKPQINHIDGNGENNNVTNLEWVNGSENAKHAYDTLGRKPTWTGITGSKNPSSKAIIQYDKDMNIVAEFESTRQAEQILGFGNKPLCAALTGRSKTHKGFHWRFKGKKDDWVYKRDWKKEVENSQK